jgi:hypothetical protein
MTEGKLPERKLPDSKLRQDRGHLRRAGDCAQDEPNLHINSSEATSDPLPASGFAFPAGIGLP